MHEVFISYSHKDQEIVNMISDVMKQHGISCWYAKRDVLEPNWADEIVLAIQAAKIFVLLYSKNSNWSSDVGNELANAAYYKCRILPFRIDANEMRPGMRYYLTALHWMDALTPPIDMDIEKLCVRTKKLLDTPLQMHEQAILESMDETETAPLLAEVEKIIERRKNMQSPEAWVSLGDCYYQGIDTSVDKVEAAVCYRMAADRGHAEGWFKLGQCYHFGQGVSEDMAEAVRCYDMAAKLRHAEAWIRLGDCYSYGNGVEEDPVNAVRCYRMATKTRHAEAWVRLGNCYFNGDGVEEDLPEAERCYRKAALLGHAEAERICRQLFGNKS